MRFTMHKVKVLTIASLIVCAFLFEIVQAKTEEPGSASDPLVTKSYVAAQINSIKDQFNRSIAEVNKSATSTSENNKNLSDLNVKVKYLIDTNNQLVKNINDLNTKYNQLVTTVKTITTKNNQLSTAIKDLSTKYSQLSGQYTNNEADLNQTSSNFKLVILPEKKKLYLQEGTEIILRAGTVITYSNKDNGFIDITSGIDTKNNSNLAKNHLIVCPKYDTRYLYIKSKSYALIRGFYILK